MVHQPAPRAPHRRSFESARYSATALQHSKSADEPNNLTYRGSAAASLLRYTWSAHLRHPRRALSCVSISLRGESAHRMTRHLAAICTATNDIELSMLTA
jgi:hypothetical protein